MIGQADLRFFGGSTGVTKYGQAVVRERVEGERALKGAFSPRHRLDTRPLPTPAPQARAPGVGLGKPRPDNARKLQLVQDSPARVQARTPKSMLLLPLAINAFF